MISVYETKEASGARVTLDRRVCVDGKGKLCEDGHPNSVSLYGTAGKQVSRADFEARGGKVNKAPAEDKSTKAEVAVVDVSKPDAPRAVPAPKPRRKRKAKATPKRKTTKKGK